MTMVNWRVVFVLALTFPSLALAQDRSFTLTNNSGKVVTEFTVTPDAEDAVSVNLLQNTPIPAGEFVDVTIQASNDVCLHNLHIVFDDASVQDQHKVDFCNIDGYIIE